MGGELGGEIKQLNGNQDKARYRGVDGRRRLWSDHGNVWWRRGDRPSNLNLSALKPKQLYIIYFNTQLC